MEKIVWFEKTHTTSPSSNYDCTVTKRKNKKGISTAIIVIKFRNGVIQTLESEYIRAGLSPDGKKLFFAPAKKETGWKLGSDGNKNDAPEREILRIQIADEKLSDGLLRFLGDYEIEISEDNLLYIDSRNRK